MPTNQLDSFYFGGDMTYKIVLKRNDREIDYDEFRLDGNNPDRQAKINAAKFIQSNLGPEALRDRKFGKWVVTDHGVERVSKRGAYTVHMAKFDENGDRVAGKVWVK